MKQHLNKFVLINTCVLLVTLVLCAHEVSAYAPTNFFNAYEFDYRPVVGFNSKHDRIKSDYGRKNKNFRVGLATEYGKTRKSRDWDENKNNALQLYNERESSVAMLLGAPEGSKIDKLAKELGVSAATITADGCRGSFELTGEYEQLTAMLFGKYKLPINLEGLFELAVYIPFKSMQFNDVRWIDHTKNALSADREFREKFSSQLAQKAQELGCLDINQNGWKQEGLGDITVMLAWQKDFKQDKDYLKTVRINTQIGLTIPTGEKKDIDQALSLPLGNDGGWGIPASLGLDLNFINNIRAGVELSVLGVFDSTRTYRMRTSRHQTDFLLLNKGQATRSYGTAWKFTLFSQAKQLYKDLSGMISYHFVKHDEDRLHPKSYNFNYSIVNSTESLQEWSSHSFVFQLSYGRYLSLFYKLPLTGKRVILANTFGAQAGFTF